MQKPQMFCIPYAGGTARFFGGLSKQLGDYLEVISLEYAGHGMRSRDPFYENMQELLEDVRAQIAQRRDSGVPYVLFGYSMGALVAYDMAANQFKPDPPAHLFVAAHEPPHIPFRDMNCVDKSDEEFLETVKSLGGIDESILQNKRFLALYLKPLQMDYRLLIQYQWSGVYQQVKCDMTIFHSRADTNEEYMQQWRQHTAGKAELIEYSGRHFFLKEHEEEIAEDVMRSVNNLL